MNLKIEVVGYAVKNNAGDVFGIYTTQEHAELAIVSIGPWFGELFVKQTLVARPDDFDECVECGDVVAKKYQADHACSRLV
jgi:hypothetical protein